MTVTIDDALIFNAITNAGYPAEATLLGSELVDAWISECLEHDKIYKTLLLEAGFFIELDAQTYIVGACDRVMQDSDGVLFEESKSTGNKKSKTYGPEQWFEQISTGHQIALYGEALRVGTFVKDEGGWKTQQFNQPEPKVLVRAVTKFKPCEIWPGPEGAIVNVTPEHVQRVMNVVRNAAASIRAMRKTGLLPWAFVTHQCTKVYGYNKYPCVFLPSCSKSQYAAGGHFAGLSPGSSEVVKFLLDSGRVSRDNAEVVILSSSSLEDFEWCAERFRRRAAGEAEEDKRDFDIGSVLHVGLAEYRKILQDQGF